MSTTKEFLMEMISPIYFMVVSVIYLCRTLLSSPFLLLRSPSAFRAQWFENLFGSFSAEIAASPIQSPYLEGLLSRAHGVVLELGPGGGDQAYHFKAAKIEKMYGVEPNEFFHPSLIAKAKEIGLGAKYVPLVAGAEPESLLPALKDAGVIPRDTTSLPKEGVFDSIIAVKSMCSAQQSQMLDTMTVLWWLLKPGGEFLFFEHVENDQNYLSQCYTQVLNLIWPALMGGCRLDGNMDKIILRMNGWEKREIENIKEYKGYEVFRFAKGICTKMR